MGPLAHPVPGSATPAEGSCPDPSVLLRGYPVSVHLFYSVYWTVTMAGGSSDYTTYVLLSLVG